MSCDAVRSRFSRTPAPITSEIRLSGSFCCLSIRWLPSCEDGAADILHYGLMRSR